MSQALTMKELLKVKEQDRNYQWEEKFFKLFSESHLRLLTTEPQEGPDGWPYLISELVDEEQVATESKNDNVDSAQKILAWLAQKGIGLVVNPRREPYPDYVFSYGMIWSFRETGYFNRPDLAVESGKIEYDLKNIYSGEPTLQYLPIYVRQILKAFFQDQMVLQPKILMISPDQKHYDLAFSLESLGNPPESEHSGIAEAISWFLPPHYSVVLASEQSLPEFKDLLPSREQIH